MNEQDQQPAQPSTPMSGSGGRRRMPFGQDGDGNSEIDFAAYIPPSSHAELLRDGDPANRFMPLLSRRRLQQAPSGYRRV